MHIPKYFYRSLLPKNFLKEVCSAEAHLLITPNKISNNYSYQELPLLGGLDPIRPKPKNKLHVMVNTLTNGWSGH